MRHLDLLESYPRSTRPIAERHRVAEENRAIAKRFGQEYFDGTRMQGYGGYIYDGRWVPIARRMQQCYGLAPGHRVLDIGCAKGFLMHDLATLVPGLEVVGLDVSGYALEHAMPSLTGRLFRATATELPFAARSFDLVVSINVVHNLPLDACCVAIAEMERVSRQFKYIQVDSFLTEQQRANLDQWQLTAVTYFDPHGWCKLFRQAGYTGDYNWTITK